MRIRLIVALAVILVLCTGPLSAMGAGVVTWQHPGRTSVGLWQGLWHTEHGALALYRRLQAAAPTKVIPVAALITAQKQQLALLRALYESTMEPGSTPLTAPDVSPEIPPAKVPWTAHQPPAPREIARTALDYERRALQMYESIAADLAGQPAARRVATLLTLQQEQLRVLLGTSWE